MCFGKYVISIFNYERHSSCRLSAVSPTPNHTMNLNASLLFHVSPSSFVSIPPPYFSYFSVVRSSASYSPRAALSFSALSLSLAAMASYFFFVEASAVDQAAPRARPSSPNESSGFFSFSPGRSCFAKNM